MSPNRGPFRSKNVPIYKSGEENLLQEIYDEAYRSFVDSMFEEAQGNDKAASEDWRHTLDLISKEHVKIVASRR